MLVSAGLGFRLLGGAYYILSDTIQTLYPEIAAANPSFITTAKTEMPLDILAGLFLLF